MPHRPILPGATVAVGEQPVRTKEYVQGPTVLLVGPTGPTGTGETGPTGPAGADGVDGADGTVNLRHAPFIDLDISAGAVEIDLAEGGVFRLILDADATTVTMAGVTNGEANFWTLHVKQDATGGRAFTPPASWTFSTGDYVVSSAANSADLLQGISYDNGTTWLVSYLKNYI